MKKLILLTLTFCYTINSFSQILQDRIFLIYIRSLTDCLGFLIVLIINII